MPNRASRWCEFGPPFRPRFDRIGIPESGAPPFRPRFEPLFRTRGRCFRESGGVCEVGMMRLGPRFGPRFRTRGHCFRKSRGVRGPAWCDLVRLLGHVLGRGARRTPVSQCQIERRGGASRRLFLGGRKSDTPILHCEICHTRGSGSKTRLPLSLCNQREIAQNRTYD